MTGRVDSLLDQNLVLAKKIREAVGQVLFMPTDVYMQVCKRHLMGLYVGVRVCVCRCCQ